MNQTLAITPLRVMPLHTELIPFHDPGTIFLQLLVSFAMHDLHAAGPPTYEPPADIYGLPSIERHCRRLFHFMKQRQVTHTYEINDYRIIAVMYPLLLTAFINAHSRPQLLPWEETKSAEAIHCSAVVQGNYFPELQPPRHHYSRTKHGIQYHCAEKEWSIRLLLSPQCLCEPGGDLRFAPEHLCGPVYCPPHQESGNNSDCTTCPTGTIKPTAGRYNCFTSTDLTEAINRFGLKHDQRVYYDEQVFNFV